MSPESGNRAEQRRRTESRILRAARRQFAAAGFEATTIRAIAAEAETDPGLVMRYFGAKADLFAKVAGVEPDAEISGTPSEAAEQLLAALTHKLEEQPLDALAALRAMFTHPAAATEIQAAMSARQTQAAAHLSPDDADLRAALISALTLGTVLSRHLLRLPALDTATPDRIAALLRPAFHHLAYGTPRNAEGRWDVRDSYDE
ncbi:TetR/AcrR family transcriptional regulator [Nocardia panacis]|uniref:TetR/AcrR family transcriptional regulator n=1 Tax=Nocardia panacis TaxID=2340916 RepID=A0A3A4K1N0_9NOCA|nr:TetR/AcrR family transcriptional regulator [Nocardia panacis]RJO73650.1 TetR/AcrR family transcriptional regulator [Nocardia panacis]